MFVVVGRFGMMEREKKVGKEWEGEGLLKLLGRSKLALLEVEGLRGAAGASSQARAQVTSYVIGWSLRVHQVH